MPKNHPSGTSPYYYDSPLGNYDAQHKPPYYDVPQPGYGHASGHAYKGHPPQATYPDHEASIKLALSTRPKYQDVWAAVLFWGQVIAMIVVLFVCIGSLANSNQDGGDGSGLSMTPHSKNKTKYAIFMCFLVSILFTILYMMAMYKFPRGMVIGSFVATVILWVLIGSALLFNGAIVPALVFIFIAFLQTILVYSWRKRIPLSALLLETTISILKCYPNTLIVAAIQYLVQLAYVVLWITTLAAVASKKYDSSTQTLLVVYLAFSFFWTTQVLKNVLHVIISGLFATYYFVMASDQTVTNPTAGSARRAMTYSFGSIAFGSLLIALVQTLRFILNMFRDRDSFVGACVDCILSCIEGLAEYFNYYAFTQVAIFGKPYIQAAKDTWELIKRAGAEVIMNDILLEYVLSIAVLTATVLSGAIGFLYVYNDVQLTNEHKASITAISAALGLVTMLLVTEVIHSGVSTTLVCYCENPDALRRTKPELYARFVAANNATSATQEI